MKHESSTSKNAPNSYLRPKLRLYFGETHNSWEDICCGRARFLVIIGLAGKNNPIGNVFSGLLLHYRAI